MKKIFIFAVGLFLLFLSSAKAEQMSINTFDLRDSAEAYALGVNVPKDEERAKHLFRSSMAFAFSIFETGDACAEQMLEYGPPKLLLEKEQFTWFTSLCYKPDKELFKIADWYMRIHNPYRSPIIAERILFHLDSARQNQKAWALHSKALEEITR